MSFPLRVRKSAAEQLCVILQDEVRSICIKILVKYSPYVCMYVCIQRFWPILSDTQLVQTVFDELSDYSSMFLMPTHTQRERLLMPCLRLLLLISMHSRVLMYANEKVDSESGNEESKTKTTSKSITPTEVVKLCTPCKSYTYIHAHA